MKPGNLREFTRKVPIPAGIFKNVPER